MGRLFLRNLKMKSSLSLMMFVGLIAIQVAQCQDDPCKTKISTNGRCGKAHASTICPWGAGGTGGPVYCSSDNWCGVTPAHKNTAQKDFSSARCPKAAAKPAAKPDAKPDAKPATK